MKISRQFTPNVFRAFPSRKLKFLAFNISKQYFLFYFFILTPHFTIYQTSKVLFFFITSFKYYFFILLLFSLSSYLCLSLSLKKPTTFFSIQANPLTQPQPQPWLAATNHHHQKKKKNHQPIATTATTTVTTTNSYSDNPPTTKITNCHQALKSEPIQFKPKFHQNNNHKPKLHRSMNLNMQRF